MSSGTRFVSVSQALTVAVERAPTAVATSLWVQPLCIRQARSRLPGLSSTP